jgi:hypothetical protein
MPSTFSESDGNEAHGPIILQTVSIYVPLCISDCYVPLTSQSQHMLMVRAQLLSGGLAPIDLPGGLLTNNAMRMTSTRLRFCTSYFTTTENQGQGRIGPERYGGLRGPPKLNAAQLLVTWCMNARTKPHRCAPSPAGWGGLKAR